MKEKILQGSLPSLVTPFNEDESIDEDSLRNEIDFVINEGAHGIVINALLGEGFKLSEQEKKHVLEITIDQTRGRVPIINAIITNSTKNSIEQANLSEKLGVKALLLPPPSFYPVTSKNIYEYYISISKAVNIDIIVHEVPIFIRTSIGIDTIKKIIDVAGNVKYLKLELPKPGPEISTYTSLLGDRCFLIWGLAGMFMIEAYKRGAVGIIGPPQNTKAVYQIHEYLKEKNEKAAQKILNKYFQLLAFKMSTGSHAQATEKKALYWKGVIKNDKLREPAQTLDKIHEEELRELLISTGEKI